MEETSQERRVRLLGELAKKTKELDKLRKKLHDKSTLPGYRLPRPDRDNWHGNGTKKGW